MSLDGLNGLCCSLYMMFLCCDFLRIAYSPAWPCSSRRTQQGAAASCGESAFQLQSTNSRPYLRIDRLAAALERQPAHSACGEAGELTNSAGFGSVSSKQHLRVTSPCLCCGSVCDRSGSMFSAPTMGSFSQEWIMPRFCS